MDLRKLDKALRMFVNRESIDYEEFNKEFVLSTESERSNIIKLLVEKGYLKREVREAWLPTPNHPNQNGYFTKVGELHITPQGSLFIAGGGYTQEETYRLETLLFAKQSRNYAKWALWVSILGILISILLFCLQK